MRFAILMAPARPMAAQNCRNIRGAGTAIGMIVAAAVVALTALNVLTAALVAALAELGIPGGWSALIVGVALAVGAAIGAALPQTRIGQDRFGDTADDLLQEAERIYAEERAKLGAVAQKAAKDMGEVVEKAASDAVYTIRPAEDGTGPDRRSGTVVNQAGKSAQQDADMPPPGPRKATPGDSPS